MTLDDFKKAHGAAWVKIIQNPAFQAAMLLLGNRKIEVIASLSDEHIEKHSREVLGDLRGHFKYENDLLNLHNMREFKLPVEEEQIYLSPEQEAELLAEQEPTKTKKRK